MLLKDIFISILKSADIKVSLSNGETLRISNSNEKIEDPNFILALSQNEDIALNLNQVVYYSVINK